MTIKEKLKLIAPWIVIALLSAITLYAGYSAGYQKGAGEAIEFLADYQTFKQQAVQAINVNANNNKQITDFLNAQIQAAQTIKK